MSEARRQGLGGSRLGADSPLFGGPLEQANGKRTGSAVRDPEEPTAWDPRPDEFAQAREVAEAEAKMAARELLSREDLLKAKRASGRAKDFNDIRHLEKNNL